MSFKVCFVLLSVSVILLNAESTCGVVGKSSANIETRVSAKAGAWPWIASLHKASNDEFFCGGTLVGEKIVITVRDFSQLKAKYFINFRLILKGRPLCS